MMFNIYYRGQLVGTLDESEGIQTSDYAARVWSDRNRHLERDFIHAEGFDAPARASFIDEFFAARPANGAAFARRAVAATARETREHSARVKMAELVLAVGNYTETGEAVWREYLAAGCPAAPEAGK